MGFGSNPLPSGRNYFPGQGKNRASVLTFNQTTSSNVLGVKIDGIFDAVNLCQKIRDWEVRVLKRVGGYTRRVMKNSMKAGKYRPDKRQKSKNGEKTKTVRVHSDKGKPPVYWESRLIKDSIFYYVDPHLARVIIGPQQFNRSKGGHMSGALEVLEFGGNVSIQNENFYVAKRPYASPAQEIGAQQVDKFIRESKNVF